MSTLLLTAAELCQQLKTENVRNIIKMVSSVGTWTFRPLQVDRGWTGIGLYREDHIYKFHDDTIKQLTEYGYKVTVEKREYATDFEREKIPGWTINCFGYIMLITADKERINYYKPIYKSFQVYTVSACCGQ